MTKEETIKVLQSIENRAGDFPCMTACDWVAIAAAKRHLENSVDKKKLKKRVLKYVAHQFIKWLDASILKSKMYLSDMECKDIEDAFLKDDWARISYYMYEKFYKQWDIHKEVNNDENTVH